MKRVTDIGDLGAFVEHDTPITKAPKADKVKGNSLGTRGREEPGKTEVNSIDVVRPSGPITPVRPSPRPSPTPPGPSPEPPHGGEASSPWPWLAAALGVALVAGGVGWAVARNRCTQCQHESEKA